MRVTVSPNAPLALLARHIHPDACELVRNHRSNRNEHDAPVQDEYAPAPYGVGRRIVRRPNQTAWLLKSRTCWAQGGNTPSGGSGGPTEINRATNTTKANPKVRTHNAEPNFAVGNVPAALSFASELVIVGSPHKRGTTSKVRAGNMVGAGECECEANHTAARYSESANSKLIRVAPTSRAAIETGSRGLFLATKNA